MGGSNRKRRNDDHWHHGREQGGGDVAWLAAVANRDNARGQFDGEGGRRNALGVTRPPLGGAAAEAGGDKMTFVRIGESLTRHPKRNKEVFPHGEGNREAVAVAVVNVDNVDHEERRRERYFGGSAAGKMATVGASTLFTGLKLVNGGERRQ